MDDSTKRLQDDDAAMWSQFIEIVTPHLRSSIQRVVADEETREDLIGQVIVHVVAAFGKLDPNYQPPHVTDKTSALYTPFSLKPEHRNTPLQDVTVDMFASIPDEPGIIFCLNTNGPAKVLRHEESNVSFAGQVFATVKQAARAMKDAWTATETAHLQ